MVRSVGRPDFADAVRELAASADDLYAGADDGALALAAMARADEALARIEPLGDASAIAAAREALATARTEVAAGAAPWRVRMAANRVYEAAVLSLDGAGPGTNVSAMLLSLLLREVEVSAAAGEVAEAGRTLLFARGTWRALLLEGGSLHPSARAELDAGIAGLQDALERADVAGLRVAAARAVLAARELELYASPARAPFRPAPALDRAGESQQGSYWSR